MPLDKTVAMLNMDMVGRLEDEKLIIQGVDTAKEFGPLIDGLNERFGYGFDISRKSGGFGPSDHASFYSKQIPGDALLHRAAQGLSPPERRRREAQCSGHAAGGRDGGRNGAAAGRRPGPADLCRKQERGRRRPAAAAIVPISAASRTLPAREPGYAISGVSKDSPADKGGLKGGDVIIKFGDSKIGSLEDFDSALRKYKRGTKSK